MNFRSTPGAPPPLLSFFRTRGPQKLSGGSHKDGWGSAACSTFFTADRWWQVSAPLQASTSETGRVAPWWGGLLKSNSRYLPPPVFSALVRAPRLLPTGALHGERPHKKTGSLQGDEMRPSVVTKWKLRARLPPLLLTGKSDRKPPAGSVHRCSRESDNMTSLVWLSVRSCLFPLRLIHTPCRQSELQPDWRQTRRGGTAHRSPALQQLAVEGGTQNLERIRSSARTGFPPC